MSCNRLNFISRDHLRERHYSMEDGEFASAFEDRTLAPEDFSHEAHLRLAWILIRSHGLARATDMLCAQIDQFDRYHGNGMKFNRQITEAAARIVYNFQKASKAQDFKEFLQKNPRMITDFRGLITAYQDGWN